MQIILESVHVLICNKGQTNTIPSMLEIPNLHSIFPCCQGLQSTGHNLRPEKAIFYCYHDNIFDTILLLLWSVQEDVLSVLAKHLDESALQTRSFLVDVSGTSIDEEHISEQVL